MTLIRTTTHSYSFKTDHTSWELLEKLKKSLKNKFRNTMLEVDYDGSQTGYTITSRIEIGKKLDDYLTKNLDKWIAEIGENLTKKEQENKEEIESNIKNIPLCLYVKPKNGDKYPGLDALYGVIMNTYGEAKREYKAKDYGQALMYWNDMLDLLDIQDTVDKGNLSSAYDHARQLDTAVRDDIPNKLWNLLLTVAD